jgi:hypothetical protein
LGCGVGAGVKATDLDFGSKDGAGSTVRAADRCLSMNAREALARAAHYRDVARQVTDEQTQKGLLALAAKYEALAERLTRDTPSETKK